MDNTKVAEILHNAQWKYAKSMPKFPHWYTLKDNWIDKKSFEDIVMYIREHGYKEKFFRTEFTKLDINGYQYWTMGAPLAETILINKAKVKYNTVYDEISNVYDDLFVGEDSIKEEKQIIELFNIKEDESVLDLGCGTGLLLKYNNIKDYTGIDISNGMLDKLKNKYISHSENIHCIDVNNFYGFGKKYDKIISLYAGDYIKNETVDRLKSLLSPNGKMYLVYYKEGYNPLTYIKTNTRRPVSFANKEDGLIINNYKIVTYENI